MLSLIRTDFPLNPAISMLQTLQSFQHSIGAAFGDSKGTYGDSEIRCIHPTHAIR